MLSSPQQEAVDAAITSRRSIRAFLDKPVAREDIARILDVSARAPSGTNTQPWKVHVLTGAARERLSDAILAANADPEQARLSWYQSPTKLAGVGLVLVVALNLIFA